MDPLKVVREWMRKSADPVKHCNVYRSVGCAHVDGMLCNMRTCDIVVNIQMTPSTLKEVNRLGRWYEDMPTPVNPHTTKT